MGNAQLGLEICWGQNSDKKEECEAQWVDPNQSVQIFLGKWSFQFKCSNRANNAEIPIVHYFLNFWWPRQNQFNLHEKGQRTNETWKVDSSRALDVAPQSFFSMV